MDAGPRELLERGALGRVVAVDGGDQRLEAARDEVLDVTAGGQLAHLLEDDVLDERRIGHDQAVADLHVAGALVLRPEGHRILGGDAAAFGGGLHFRGDSYEGRSDGRGLYRVLARSPSSPIRGNRVSALTRRPRRAPPRPRSTSPPARPGRAPGRRVRRPARGRGARARPRLARARGSLRRRARGPPRPP